MKNDEREKYVKLLKKKLSDYRLKHSLCVADEAVRLAKKYGADVEKAELAGLLHDIMKDADKSDQLKLIENELTPLEKAAPKLWHSIAGAVYIREKLGIEDEEIFNAVRYHTTARAGMTLLEKVVFLADFTSSDRDYDGVKKMRKAVENDVDTAMREALAFSISNLLEHGNAIHSDTFFAYNEIVTERKS